MTRAITFAAVLGIAVAGCSKERNPDETVACESFRPKVQTAFADRCAECHSGDAPEGNYDLTTYNGAIGPGSDGTPNAIAGDASSLLLEYVTASTADEVHAGFVDLQPLVTDWIVTCELSYFDSDVHQPGLLNPDAQDFHGALLLEAAWDFGVCADCHGAAFDGGKAKTSCLTCHPEGPKACDTCHGTPPASGAHATHVGGGALGRSYDCDSCHVVPEDVFDPGHILISEGVVDTAPAEVTFGEFAGLTLPGYERAGEPAYDPATGACSNVYCHGAVLGDSAAAVVAPVWTDVGQGQAACGACHGIAPSSHADDRCGACHPGIATDDAMLVDLTRHVDGALVIGLGNGDCGDCHGGGPDGSPPPDLAGGTSTDLMTVGAHAAHVLGPTRLRGPIPCSDCHLVPTEVGDVGHIDSPAPAEVFPGGAGFGGLAAANGAVPAFNRASGTCSDVYCHGGGTSRLEDDTAPTLARSPQWTRVGDAQAACGTCHGVPPLDGFHPTDITLLDCHNCHSGSVDEFGNIIVSGPPGMETSNHMDGDVP